MLTALVTSTALTLKLKEASHFPVIVHCNVQVHARDFRRRTRLASLSHMWGSAPEGTYNETVANISKRETLEMTTANKQLLEAFDGHDANAIRAALDAGADAATPIEGKLPIEWLLEQYWRTDRLP